MDDEDEVQVVEVTVRSTSTASSKKKRKREDSPAAPPKLQRLQVMRIFFKKQLSLKEGYVLSLFSAIVEEIIMLEFCDKEKDQLSKRFKELEEKLTEKQRCELDVKLENSEKRVPLICVGDSDNEDDEVVFILPEDYSPRKRRRIDIEKKAEKFDETGNQPKKDVAITYFQPGTNLPHAREHCTVHKFVQSNVTTATVSCNESHCEQCYCYVCDVLVKECGSWKTGINPHCSAYSKNAFWEQLRKTAKRKTVQTLIYILI
ncbi:hypothetical protein OS493_013315 [Desmophyllum pertusum]|uniref:Uncharacterized protein n=1 Tax=Desmophyllum pertusum TaxID=174260 RepID=A0A9W9YGW0_9CNID|nr:hypothetical protein OS493_013315 [Desmophyllum pertusum]